ncbi:hypothetical protein KY284_000872 [Solanum tuberosum]|nr:hypothetical protein KY284_000872 [Solanum tuberosum]
MVKFGDFKPIDVNESLSLPTLCDVVSIGEGLTKEDGDQVDHFDDWGWTLVTRRKHQKASSHKYLTKRHFREKMVRIPRIKTLIVHLKKEEIKVHHYQKLRQSITLGEYLPSWFYTKFTCNGTKGLCCNVDENEAKDATSSCPSPKDSSKLSPEVEDVCMAKITFFDEDLLLVGTKTSYNILLGRPRVHENKVIPSTYHQCLKYYEDGVAKKIIVDNNPFTEAEAHFADTKFYLKKYATKIGDIASKDDEPLNKKSKVVVYKTKVVSKEDRKLGILDKTPNMNSVFLSKKVRPILCYVPKSKNDDGHSLKLQENALEGLNFPVKRIDVMKSSPKSLGKFVAPKSSKNEALPMRRTNEGFDFNASRLLAKAGYNPTKPSKLGKLPLEPAARQQCEGLGYKQPPPICISIRRVSNNYINAEDEPIASNKRPSIFDRLGNSTMRISIFEILGPLKKENKLWRNNRSIRASVFPKLQNVPKDFQSDTF